MQKIKILHISSALPPQGKGGQDKFVLKIVNHFQDKYKIIALVKQGNLIQKNYKIYTYQTKFKIRNIVILFKKISYLIKNVDLIHFHYPVPFLPEIPVIPIFLFINFFLKKDYFVHIHLMTKITHFLSKIIIKPFKIMQKYLFKSSRLILTPTQLTRKDLYLNYGIPLKNIFHVSYGVSDSFFNLNQNRQKKDNIKIIYVGRLHKSKRIDFLIKAVLDLPEKYRLEIYGDGDDYRRLYKLASNSYRINFHGFTANEEQLLEAYKDADLMVLPSTSEEMPLSILEGLASGVPVLCSDLPTIKSEYKSNVIYLKDIKNLKLKILETINQRTQNFLEKGRNFASENRWRDCFNKIDNLYLQFINERK